MNSSSSTLALLVFAPLLTAAAFQTRVKPKEAADFPALLRAADQAWNNAEYGTCTKMLNDALGLVMEKRTEAIRAALPEVPGFKKVEPKKNDAQANPFAAAMMGSVGNIVEQEYRSDEKGRVRVTVTADSPLVRMFSMWAANPAMIEAGSELIDYEGDKALLKKQGNSLNLQIMIAEKHICEVDAGKLSEDELFAAFNQDAVNRLKKILEN